MSGASTGDHARVKCLQAYKEELKKNIGKVSSMYEGYLLNYSAKDGSLLGPVTEKVDVPEVIRDKGNTDII